MGLERALRGSVIPSWSVVALFLDIKFTDAGFLMAHNPSNLQELIYLQWEAFFRNSIFKRKTRETSTLSYSCLCLHIAVLT